jgi:hypothetical protein
MTETYNDKESYFYTANIKVATALATMGFAMKQPEPVTRMVRPDGKESTVFWFDELSTTGAKARDVVLGMTKEADALDSSDPENPINYIRAALLNRDTLVDLVHSTPRRIIIERNGKRIAIREDATDADKKNLATKL